MLHICQLLYPFSSLGSLQIAIPSLFMFGLVLSVFIFSISSPSTVHYRRQMVNQMIRCFTTSQTSGLSKLVYQENVLGLNILPVLQSVSVPFSPSWRERMTENEHYSDRDEQRLNNLAISPNRKGMEKNNREIELKGFSLAVWLGCVWVSQLLFINRYGYSSYPTNYWNQLTRTHGEI